MEFLNFTSFCGRIDSNGLFNMAFLNYWIRDNHWWPGLDVDDDFNMFCIGGEI